MMIEWEDIIIKGNLRHCPNPSCKAGGSKNEEWLHMKWCACGTEYCYFCGKSLADWDKKGGTGGLANHNVDWQKNSARCPIFLTQIQDIDERWVSVNDKACLNLFHKILRYTYIRAFINKHTREKFDQFWEVFDSVKNSGYNIEEAMTMDLTFIKRK